MKRTLGLSIAFGLYFLYAIGITWYCYGHIETAYAAGQAVGSLVLPLLVAAFIAVKSKTIKPILISLAIGAVLLTYVNADEIGQAGHRRALDNDALQLKADMAGATPENYRDRLAASKTKLGHLMTVLFDAVERGGKQVRGVLLALDDSSPMLTRDTLLRREKRNALRPELMEKIELAKHAPTEIDKIYQQLRNDVLAATNGAPGFRAGYMETFDKNTEVAEKPLREVAMTYADTYTHVIAMYDILDENDGRFTIREDGMILFQDTAPLASYNAETSAVRTDLDKLVKLNTTLQEMSKGGTAKMVNAIQ